MKKLISSNQILSTMNNFNPNYNVCDNGDGNNELFSSQNQIWHSYAHRLNKPSFEPNSHQNVAGNDFIGAPGENYYNKHVPQNRQAVPSHNNYAGPSSLNYLPFQDGRNNFNYPVPSLPIFNEPPNRQPVPSYNNYAGPASVNNFPVQSPVSHNGDFYDFFLNNQHERTVKSVNGNEVKVLTYTRDVYDQINLGKNFNCNFCKRLGKPK